MVFKWKEGTRYKVDANIAGAMCSEMEKAGMLTAQNLVDANRPEDAPLHSEFDWDDTEAAEKWRTHQARNIIHSIVIASETEEKDSGVRLFFHIDRTTPNYESVTAIVREEDKYAALLKTALTELRAFQRKYAQLEELASIFAEIEKIGG